MARSCSTTQPRRSQGASRRAVRRSPADPHRQHRRRHPRPENVALVLAVVVLVEEGGEVGVAERPDRHPGLLVVTGGPDAVWVGVGLGPCHGGLLVVLAGGPLGARPEWGHLPPRAGSCLVLLGTVNRRRAGCWRALGLAVAVGAVLAALDSGDGLAGVVPGGPLGRLARHRAQRGLGGGDPIGAAGGLHGGPGPPPR